MPRGIYNRKGTKGKPGPKRGPKAGGKRELNAFRKAVEETLDALIEAVRIKTEADTRAKVLQEVSDEAERRLRMIQG